MSRRDDASICRGKANQVKAPGPEIQGPCENRLGLFRSIIQYRFPEEFGPASACRAAPRTDALHAGNASAGVAKTSPYIEEAS